MINNPIINWRNQQNRYQNLGKTGTIISFTKVYQPPRNFGKLPYYIGVIELKNKRVTAQLVIENKLPKIGDKVKAVLRIIGQPSKEGIINYGVKFKVL